MSEQPLYEVDDLVITNKRVEWRGTVIPLDSILSVQKETVVTKKPSKNNKDLRWLSILPLLFSIGLFYLHFTEEPPREPIILVLAVVMLVLAFIVKAYGRTSKMVVDKSWYEVNLLTAAGQFAVLRSSDVNEVNKVGDLVSRLIVR